MCGRLAAQASSIVGASRGAPTNNLDLARLQSRRNAAATWALAPGSTRRMQGLKPGAFCDLAAGLKSCPDTNQAPASGTHLRWNRPGSHGAALSAGSAALERWRCSPLVILSRARELRERARAKDLEDACRRSRPVWAQEGYFVYIMSSQRRVLYVGISDNLPLLVLQNTTMV